MACCPTQAKKYGYDHSRFEKDVDEHFHCSICYNVLKDPRMCHKNEHVFCHDCITEHLKVNSQTCPECNDHLTVDMLRRPRLLTNYLSKLKINCDHADRGCPEFICVENLESHVESCGFTPVMCSNENCGMEINKQDKDHHENEVCEYRKMKCQDCGKMQEVVGRLEGSLMELDGKVEKMNIETKKNHVDMKKIVGKLVGKNENANEKVEAVRNRQEEVKREVGKVKKEVGEVKKEVGKVKKEVGEVKKEVGEVKKEVGEVKREVKDVKENISKVNKDVDEVKVMMSQVLEKLNMLEHLNKLPSPTEGMLNTRPREDILIAGGYGDETGTEIFSWEKNGWFEVSPMNEVHAEASSFIYKDQLFLAGGEDSKTIETLHLNVLPLKWRKFPVKLPYECGDHQTVVYQDRVIHIGGYNDDEDEVSNVISELQLTSPYNLKELCQMPEPRGCHGAEIFEDKVLILGGVKSDACEDYLDSVLEFDVKTNQCKEMPPLPHPLTSMATVQWRDQVVVLGGLNKDYEVLNDVFMYNIKTGKITVLPSMLEKRWGCCAVITGDTIVVMGGRNDDQYLKSVECFTMGSSTWEYLPAMNETRWLAVAEVLPSTRKYV